MIRRRTSRIGKRHRGLLLESLERRDLLAMTPVISEFMAMNVTTLEDEDGDYSDWIELFNPGNEPVNLNGYWLTDRANDLTGWRVPDLTIGPGGYRVIFASGKDRDDPDGELHTDFRLSDEGEYLALVGPDGTSVVHEYAPQYPPQVADVAYGVAPDVQTTNLVAPNASARYHVPQSNLLQNQWPFVEFNDATWTDGNTGLGYDTGEEESDPMVEAILALDPLGYSRFEETENTPAINQGRLGASLNGTYNNISSLNFKEPGPGPEDPLFGFGDDNLATEFDGRNDYVSTSQSVMSFREQFTMVGMIKQGQLTTGRVGLFGQNDVVEFGFINPTTLQVWTPNGGSLDYNYGTRLNEWHHVAVVGDGTDLRLYVDGVLVQTGGNPTGNYGSSGFGFNIGGGGIFDTTGNYFTGVIDEVAVFDKALTYEQVNSLVADGEPGGGGGDADFTDFIATNVQSDMYEKSSSLWVRIPFSVADPSRFNQLTLGMQYDDGFVAYINGVEAARRNAAGEEDEPLSFDAAASRRQADRNAVVPELIDISDSRDLLQPGTNVLGIHLLNASADNPDLLLLPTLDTSVVVVNPDESGYLTTPTPGDNNNPISTDLGPLVTDVRHTPHEPTQSQSIVVTATVVPTLQDVSRVELIYRVMYDAEITIAMVDDGTGDDAAGRRRGLHRDNPGWDCGAGQYGSLVRACHGHARIRGAIAQVRSANGQRAGSRVLRCAGRGSRLGCGVAGPSLVGPERKRRRNPDRNPCATVLQRRVLRQHVRPPARGKHGEQPGRQDALQVRFRHGTVPLRSGLQASGGVQSEYDGQRQGLRATVARVRGLLDGGFAQFDFLPDARRAQQSSSTASSSLSRNRTTKCWNAKGWMTTAHCTSSTTSSRPPVERARRRERMKTIPIFRRSSRR